MSKRIEVTVSPQGEVKLETKGYTGADCLLASKAIEQALGVSEGDKKTAEYYQQNESQQEAKQ